MKRILLFFALFTISFTSNAQLTINSTQNPAQLIQNVLLGNGVTVSNIKFNGSAANANSLRDQVGHFTNGATTNIGLDEGIIMSTGKTIVAIGPNNAPGTTNPPSDPSPGFVDADLSQLTTNPVRNKAVLEFDFIPMGQDLSFDFVFASEEYNEYTCAGVNDAFGFFLSGPGIAGPFTGGAINIALVPNTSVPISINTVNNGSVGANGNISNCSQNGPGSGLVNSAYFVNNPQSAASTIQYDGFTTTIAALGTVQCGQTYHIKLAIANVSDNAFDSAVFIKANSFNTTPVNLPNDYLVSNGFAPCNASTVDLDSGLASTVLHEWYFNGVLIAGATGPILTVSQPGQYCLTAYPYGAACPSSDCITIEFLTPMPIGEPIPLALCTPGPTLFDLGLNTPIILNGANPANYEINYHHSAADANNVAGAIPNFANYPGTDGEIIFVSIQDYFSGSGCIEVRSFTLNFTPTPTATISGTTTICSGTTTVITFNGTANATVTYTVDGGVGQTIVLDATGVATVTTPALTANSTYALVSVASAGTPVCSQPQSGDAIVTVVPLPTATISGTTTICSGTTAVITFNGTANATVTYTVDNGANQTVVLDAAGVTTVTTPVLTASSTYALVSVTSAGPPVCSQSQSGSAIVTVNALPIATISGTTAICSGTSTTITFNGTANATVTYTIDGGANQTIVLDGAGAGTVTTPVLTASSTYALVSVSSAGALICSQSQSGSAIVTVNPLPTVTISGTTTICSGSSTAITFNGTPNAIVTYNIDGGGDLTTTLDGTGTSTVSTGNITTPTIFNLISVSTNTGAPICSQNQTGSATVSIVSVPVITDPTPLQVCDDNNDGIATFILTTKDNEITGGQPNLEVSYHETPTDAQNGVTPIMQNPYQNIVSGIQTIYIRVSDIAAPQCASFTTMQLIVNPRPIPNPAISNYELCDANSPGDEVENFNLPTKSLEILNGQTGSVVTYYETQLDAQNETSPIDTTVLYLNTANPQQIWIRLENNTTGCFSVSSFQLVVNPLPTVVAPNPMNACSNGVPDVAEFNLPLNDSTISGGVPNVTVSYYLTLSDAQNEVNPLAIPYTNISNPQTVYVNVKNNTTGCSDTTSLVLNVTQGPTANTPSALEVCDPNSDGFAAFDLESANNEISGGSVPAGVTITYHETQTDAQNGTNALTSPYTNIVVNTQPIYVRVSYALTGCSNFVTLQLIVHSTPEATAIAPLEVCDDNADGFASFNLTTATAGILGGLDPAQHAVSYYVLQADAQSGTSPILSELNYVNTTANAQTIWVRVEHTTTGCFDVISLGLIVNPLPSAPFPVPSYSLCDYNTPGDGIEEFDLSTKIPQIVGLQTGLDVTFHLNASDATAGINEITNPTTYSNIVNAQTLHVRVENVATNCFVVTTMDIRVEPLPSPVQPPAPIAECDANGDGFAFFDLDALIPGILNGASPITTEITFHETVIDAQNGNNDLLSPYENINPFVHFIQVRAQNTLTGCYSIIQIELNVNSSPIIPASTVLQDLTECDADNNNQNGFTAFDLTVQTPILEAAQSGPAGDYEIRYYTTQANAQAGINPIIGEDSFINTANPQTIWVVVNNTVTGCSNIGTFQLIVGIPLALTTPAPLSLCDDGPTTPVPTTEFDLTVKNNEITQNLPGYTVAYYLTYADALADTNVIPNPTAYTNVTNAQTLWAAVTSAAGCRSYTTLTIRVMPLPTPETDPAELVKCDDNNSPNGTELFDLTTNESYIANGDLGLTFAYYPTQADAEAQTNEIALPTLDPTAYEAATGTIWIRVMNNQVSFSGNNCYVLVQQSMLVNPLPIVAANPITYTFCDVNMTGIATFTLSEMDDDLLGTTQNVSDFTITYHFLQSEAQTGANPLPNSYDNISNPQDIYPRIVNNTTGCVNFTSEVTLVVAAGATATAPAAFATCDYDFATGNGIYTIDLTQFDAEALAGQDPLLFTVAYFATEAEAIAGTNPITTPAAYPASTGMVWIVVTNETTLCRSNETFVSITVEPLAEPVIASTSGSDTICVEWGTNVLLSGLTLDSGITDPNYTFQWSLNGQPILINGTNSTYVIDTVAPGDYTVVATSTSVLGCVSNISAPFPVIQSGPAVAIGSGYTVSDAFSENQVITVTVQGHGVYHYQLDNGPIVDNGGVFTNVGLGSHDIQVYDVKGITACSPFQINDIQTINYPNYFTPNGDGIHDTWNIIGLSSQSNAKIYIFDRYGKLIKQISPSSPTGWDGTYNGQLLSSSDYWFTVDYSEAGVDKVFKAHFSLKR